MIDRLPIGILGSNCYMILDPETRRVAIIDPGFEDARPLLARLQELGATPTLVLNTHGHFDHINGNALIVNERMRLGIHPLDQPLLMSGGGGALLGFRHCHSPAPTLDLLDGMTLELGEVRIHVIHTPGHTPGSICLHIPMEEALITGDTLFAGSVGRTDLPGGSPRDLTDSLLRLSTLPSATRIYPGHGEPSTLHHELRSNPWLRRLAQPPH